jgi:hypothetical protein
MRWWPSDAGSSAEARDSVQPMSPRDPLLPRTRAELTDHRETSRHADVLAFLDDLAARTDLVHRTTMGRSGEGQDMAVLVVSGDGCFTPEEARRQGKLVVMVEANIHAGEVEGKEAVLALARDLTLTKLGQRILSRLCLVLIPDFNPDGNDRISPDNRRLDLARLEGQVNPPGGVGTRYTGDGWNLNRDATKQEAVETRNLAQLVHAWWPHVFIDCHTTDGSIHAFDLTYDTSHSNQEIFARLLRRTREMLEDTARNVERRHGFRSYWYGNLVAEDDPTSGWQTYPALPRFGSHYRGLIGRVDVLLETYSYLDFPRRCAVMYAWLLELFRYSAKHRRRLLRAVEAQEARTLACVTRRDPRVRVGIDYGVARRSPDGALLFDYPAHALDGDEAEIVSFERESIAARRYPGEAIHVYRAPHRRAFVPTTSVAIPSGYVAPAELGEALTRHGIAFRALDREAELEVESYLVLAIDKTFSPDVAGLVAPPGGAEIPLSAKPPPRRFETVLTVRPERRTVRFAEGTLVVPAAQRAGILAVYLLEPCSDDGFTRWEMLDGRLSVGGLHPVHRLLEPLPLIPT